MLDACRHGGLFSSDTYRIDNLNRWIVRWGIEILGGIPLPAHIERANVQRIFLDKIGGNVKTSDLEKMFHSIDVNNINSIEEFIAQNRDRGKEKLEILEEFLKRDEFPPFLWMEFSRFHRVFLETSHFLEKLIGKLFRFTPRRTSQLREKNRLTRSIYQAYAKFIDDYFETLSWYLKITLFMELWSCENDSELFTEKNVWTYNKFEPSSFEQILMSFHDSISQLRQSFFRFSPQETRIDFSKPTDWAFKQLVLMI